MKELDLLAQCVNDMRGTFRRFSPTSEEKAHRSAQFAAVAMNRLTAAAINTRQRWDEVRAAGEAASRPDIYKEAHKAWKDVHAAARLVEELERVMRYQDGEPATATYRTVLADQLRPVHDGVWSGDVVQPWPVFNNRPQGYTTWRSPSQRVDNDCHYCGPTKVCDC